MKADYIYYNINPEGQTLPDCVIRAISLATNIDYYKIENLLDLIGDYFSCEELCVCCYSHLLENIFNYQCFEAKGKTVSQIAKQHSDAVLLIRIDGHLTCSIDGIVFDIWDCRREVADRYWIIERY